MQKDLTIKEKISKNTLPDSISALHEFVLIGTGKLKAYRAKLKMIKDIGLAKSVKNQTLREGQEIGEAVLWADAKIGEILNGMDRRPKLIQRDHSELIQLQAKGMFPKGGSGEGMSITSTCLIKRFRKY